MTEGPQEPVESTDSAVERITRERLISFAKEKPPQDPEVRAMLIQWLNETTLTGPEEQKYEGWQYIDTVITHAIMKYRLGFLSKDEVLQELEEVGMGLASAEDGSEKELQLGLATLLSNIRGGVYHAIRPAEWFSGNSWGLPTDIDLVDPAAKAFTAKLVAAGFKEDSDFVFDFDVAFREALANTIVHGNLKVVKPDGSEETLGALAKKEQTENPSRKRVYVNIEINDEEVSVIIRDEGDGFNWQEVPDPTQPEGRFKTKGRGIMFMESYVDSVIYNEQGNEVKMVKKREKKS